MVRSSIARGNQQQYRNINYINPLVTFVVPPLHCNLPLPLNPVSCASIHPQTTDKQTHDCDCIHNTS